MRDLDELVWCVVYTHRRGETYAQQWEEDHRAGMHAPGTRRPRPRRGRCPIQLMPRNDYIVEAVDRMRADGVPLPVPFERLSEMLKRYGVRLGDKAIDEIYFRRRREVGKKILFD